MKQKLYIIGSLRNNKIPAIANLLEKAVPDCEIFADWYGAGPEADDKWKEYEEARGRDYIDALDGYAARHVFAFDRHHLDTSTHALLVLPAGKSGHMEIMYAKYKVGASSAILLEEGADPRWDVMYQFVDHVFTNVNQVEEWLCNGQGKSVQTEEKEEAFVQKSPPAFFIWDPERRAFG